MMADVDSLVDDSLVGNSENDEPDISAADDADVEEDGVSLDG